MPIILKSNAQSGLQIPFAVQSGLQLPITTVPTTLTQVFAFDIYLDCLLIGNDTSSPINIRIVDGNSNPFLPTVSIDANYAYIVPIQKEIFLSGGMSWIASATGLYAYVSGRQ